MSARPLLLCALGSILASACSVPQTQGLPSKAKDFEATIAGVERNDPASPAVLNARLSYVEFLLSEAPHVPCAKLLERAQEQLGSVEANPKSRVMFPDGWARAADLDYRLYLARASCGAEEDRGNELRTGVATAQRAVELYRKVFDYRSMATMQVNVATVFHQLGDTAAAIVALETALDMDRQYGFPDEAAENYKLLLTWRGEPDDDERITALMQDFPKRSTSLQFGWGPSDAQITVENHRACLEDGQISSSRAAASFERHIGAENGGGWSISYEHHLTRYEPGVWPTTQGSPTPQTVFPPAQLPAAGFKVSAAGEFEGVTDAKALAARLTAKTEEIIRAAAPSGDQDHKLVNQALWTMTANFSPGMLEAQAAENYQLETAMWIGAKLEQGVWYETSAPLSLPGIPRVVVEQQLQFAFTRMVPCSAGAAAQCVEIVIRATPDKEALDQAMADYELVDYTASSNVRIVVEPATLLTYAREEWVDWYASIGDGKRNSLLQSEHLVSTTSYGAH